MAKQEEEFKDKKEFKKQGKLKLPNLKIIGLVLLFGLGMVTEHYVAEPFFNAQLHDDLAKTHKDLDLLNSESASCLHDKALADTDYRNCLKDVQACKDDKFAVQQELNNCKLA